MTNHALHPFKDVISLVILFLTLVFFTTGFTALAYPCLLIISVIWVRSFTRKEAVLFTCFVFVLAVIGTVNLVVINNFLDLTWKGMYKLLLFAISAIAYRNFFFSVAKKKLSMLRLTMWLSFIATLFANAGFDLQSMQQMMIINILFMVEFYAFIHIRGDTRLLFYLTTFILIVTTKKQLWFSALILIHFIQPKLLKKYLMVFIGALLFVAVFGIIGADKAGVTTEQRASSFLTERFITPDPYGNMRLYLAFTLIPKLVEHGVFFGYGLERYGTIAAYETKRDVESTVLGLNDFIGKEYNPSSIFGSVAADMGFLTIIMQAGLAGLLLYFLMLWTLARKIKTLAKGFMVVLPYFLGGPIVYSVGLPILLGMTYAMLALQNVSDDNIKR